MAVPPPAYYPLSQQVLEREDRVTKLRTYARYVMLLLFVLLLAWLIESIRSSGASLQPFHLPVTSFLYLILGFCLLFNVAVIAVDLAELRFTRELRRKIWRAEDFIAGARPIVVVALVFAVIFSNGALLGAIEDLGTQKGDQTIEDGGNYRIDFYPSDPLDLSSAGRFKAESDRGVAIRVLIAEEEDYTPLSENAFCATDPMMEPLVAWSSKEDNTSIEGDITALRLDYAEHCLIFYNPSASPTTVRYLLRNEISRPLMANLTALCLAFFALNLAWALALVGLKRSYVSQFLLKEKQRLMRTYTLEEVFLIYRDGRLLCHNTRRLKVDMDKDVLTGMLTAVQSFVKDSFSGVEKGILNELKYGNLKILMENGPRANLAVVLSGVEPPTLRGHMKRLLADIHQRYAPVLEDWDGDTGRLRELKKEIGLIMPEEKDRARTVVEEVLLMCRDNRFMMHLSQRGQPDVDDTLLDHFHGATKEEVGKTLGTMGAAVTEIPYGNWKILIEYGVHVYLAVLVSGPPSPDLRTRMQAVMTEISTLHEQTVVNWDGSAEKLVDLRPILEDLFSESLAKAKKKR